MNYHDTLLSDFPDLMKIQDISRILHVSRQRVYFLIDNQLLRAIKPGKSYLIPKTCLIEYINRESSLA